MTRCFYFGCWNEAGHYLFAPGGRDAFRVHGKETARIEFFGNHVHLDGTLAPRRDPSGNLVFAATGLTPNERSSIGYRAQECPQGQFLLHVLDNGFTAIQWWDRCQGDTRGACNSTVLLEGQHTAEEVLAAAREHFPHVLENLERGGPPIPERPRNAYWKPPQNQGRIALVEVFCDPQSPETTERK